ncbi:MAG: HU family DNA-binding protein, partial [Sulfurovum sp.]|nr:HU family DNA-binding protein [Sulfurovum sp.]
MTKAEFVELVQENGEFETKVAAERAVKAFIDSVTKALVKKE